MLGGRRCWSLSARSLFFRSLGAIYVAAFASFWLQYPGLLGRNGLLPAQLYWLRVAGRFSGKSFLEAPVLLRFLGDGAQKLSALVTQ